MTSEAGGNPFHLIVDGFPADRFRVESFVGHEAISRPYSFDVVVTAETPSDEELERVALGQRAVFTWDVGKGERALYGVVAAVRLERVHDAGTRTVQYHVRVVPRLWLRKRRRRTRIFQKMRVREIVDAVLGEAGIGTRWQLLHEYPVHDYCTQYEESDLHFVTRLCAESGVYFYFTQGPALDAAPAAGALVPGDTVIFGDDASCYPPIGSDGASALAAAAAPALYFLAMQETATSRLDKITQFSARAVVKATDAAFRDYDPARPLARLASSATSMHPFPAPDASAGAAPIGLEVYAHHGPFLFPDWSLAKDEAPLMLRQKRRRASTAEGESGCPDLAAGHRFALAGHSATHLDRAYVVTAVEHHGHARPSDASKHEIYGNTFTCVPAEVTFIPPRPKRKSTQVALTATVVGPKGEDIHVDALGQIKVQFHWDREGGTDERSSCWIRTMQPWGGAGWGVQFIPRVGMEVVVVFEGGDPDKPMVLGSLYNGTHPPPFALPGDRTRSGFRTQTSPGGGGANELSFQDAADREQVYLHAQRNLDEVVEKNHTMLVRADEFLRVLGSRMDRVEKNLEELVYRDHTSNVDGNRVDVVSGDADVRVSKNLTTRIEGRERRDVRGASDAVYADDVTIRHLGNVTTIIGKTDKKRSHTAHAEGTVNLSGVDAVNVSSENEVVLSVGKSSIRITKDRIELNAATVATAGEAGAMSVSGDGLLLKSKDKAQLSLGKTVLIKTPDASVAMDEEVKVDGKKILLNSPEQATDAPPKDPEPQTGVELVDQDGGPLAYQRFVIKGGDGSEIGGKTDKDGKAEIDLKASGKIVFPDVTMPGDASKRDMKPYVIKQGDYLAKIAFVQCFDEQEVWNDPKNAEIKKLRANPNILTAGDVVYVPTKKKDGDPINKGGPNKYTAKIPTKNMALAFAQLANEPYVVEGLGTPQEGTSDGAGKVTLKIPVHARDVRVHFTKKNVLYPVFVGDMDPIDESAGVRRRLQHLGYQEPPSDLAESEQAASDREAISNFQEANNLPITGEADDATKAALVKAHGC